MERDDFISCDKFFFGNILKEIPEKKQIKFEELIKSKLRL